MARSVGDGAPDAERDVRSAPGRSGNPARARGGARAGRARSGDGRSRCRWTWDTSASMRKWSRRRGAPPTCSGISAARSRMSTSAGPRRPSRRGRCAARRWWRTIWVPISCAGRHELLADCVRDVEEGRAFTIDDLLATRQLRAEMWLRLSPRPQALQPAALPDARLALGTGRPFDLRWRGGDRQARRWNPTWAGASPTPFNTLGQLPVASVPSGIASGDVPTGIQIVGRPYDDVSVFRAALAYEEAFPWLRPGQTPMPRFRDPR